VVDALRGDRSVRIESVEVSEVGPTPHTRAIAPIFRGADLRDLAADPIARELEPLDRLPQALKQLRPLDAGMIASLNLPDDLAGRIFVSSSPSIQVAHLLLGLIYDPLSFAALYGVRANEFRDESSIRRVARQIGLADEVVDAAFVQAKVNKFAHAVISSSTSNFSESDRKRLTAHLLRRVRCSHSLPPPNHAKSLMAEADRLGLVGRDVDWLRGMLKAAEKVDAESIPSCIELVARGWCSGGITRGTVTGWFMNPTLEMIDEKQRAPFELALEEALKLGKTARLRDNLTIDRMNPSPIWSDAPKLNASEFDYLRVIYSYWMFAGKTGLASEALKALAQTELGKELKLDTRPSELPFTYEAFEELAKGLIEPNDIQKDKVYWWVGQLRANLELAYREMPKLVLAAIQRAKKSKTDPEVRILHMGSADGSQSFFLASAMEHCIERMKAHPDNTAIEAELARVRVRIDAVDFLEKPQIEDGKIRFAQKEGPLIPTWPLIAEEIVTAGPEQHAKKDRIAKVDAKLAAFFSQSAPPPKDDDGEAFHLLRSLHQTREITSASGLLEPTIESVPFAYRRPGGSRFQQANGVYALGGSSWEVSDQTAERRDSSARRSLSFFKGDVFDAKTYPSSDYDLVMMTNVLPWVTRCYRQSIAGSEPEKTVLERSLDALSQRTREGGTIVLDAASVVVFGNHEFPTTIHHKTPRLMDQLDYSNAEFIATDRSNLRRILLADSGEGLMELEQAKDRLRQGTVARQSSSALYL
jgi:hypothetical protein